MVQSESIFLKESILQIQQSKEDRFTYSDYLNWSDEERWELIDGIPYNMSPEPSVKHQKLSDEHIKLIRKTIILQMYA